VSRALKGSYLVAAIHPGIRAIPSAKREHIAESLRAEFRDSLDLDGATRARHPTDARWDYLLGHAGSSQVVALEAHSAETSQVSLVIEKRAASRRHLEGQLQPGESIAAWYWVASGRVDFAPHERTLNRLDKNGIQFVGGRLEAKHLAKLSNKPTGPHQLRTKPQR
jgi:hypothetical protein